MRQIDNTTLYSATDLVSFLGCQHATALDLGALGNGAASPKVDDEYLKLLADRGLEHERRHLESLTKSGKTVTSIADGSFSDRVAMTRYAMRHGADVIYQGALLAPPWHGYSDFLVRVDGVDSAFGSYAYEVVDTKLSRAARPKHVIQLCVYSELVAGVQDAQPLRTHIVLGDGRTVSLHLRDFRHYTEMARRRFDAFLTPPVAATSAEPCGHCAFCRWQPGCDEHWDQVDHLSRVAGISRDQSAYLREAGVGTLAALAELSPDARIPHLRAPTVVKLTSQARLQIGKRRTGTNAHEILPLAEGRGFGRMPKPSDGDLFFDMEGDPLYEEGLEYLFGFNHTVEGHEQFSEFWAHDRREEKLAFQNAVDFIVAQLQRFPDAHVYHYANYEEAALKRLAMLHGTREAEVDNLLRGGKLVDLYKVLKESIRVSEPSYSLKNIERFYAGDRDGAVQTAGASIVAYEGWRKSGDARLLTQLGEYNAYDCESTRKCRDWLVGLRPPETTWYAPSTDDLPTEEEDEARREAEAATAALQAALLAGVSDADQPWRELTGLLLDFHKREAKPEWWRMFDRIEAEDEKLLDDADCLAGLTPDQDHAPYAMKKSTVYTFRYPPQETRMGVGDSPLRAGTGEPAGEVITFDPAKRRISLKLGPSRSQLPVPCALIPKGPLGDEVLRAAILRYAQAVVAGDDAKYSAVTSVLRRDLPRVDGVTPGAPLAGDREANLAQSVHLISRLVESHLLVQGPPGAGKTFTSAHAIVELLARGKRVGVASNSHKAIHNILREIEDVAAERGLPFKGVKKSSSGDRYESAHGFIEDTTDARVVAKPEFQIVAGTAWVFARPEFDQALDYLLIDEAGQVSLANVVAMGVSARNLVLVGDQMQLSQPTKGVHPGGSGVSALTHLLQNLPTVPRERGIFLAETWRLHPTVCRFISDAVYESRLAPAAGNDVQTLVFKGKYDREALAGSGIRFVDVPHTDCSQESEAEADRLAIAYESLLGQSWRSRKGETKRMGVADILVISPYNLQVKLLESRLPHGARVGTVDKLQGQQGAVALISMATSSGDDMPRNVEFLFSRERLNVAISRARCLAVIFASPRLLEVPCRTIDQMRLVNMLCWAKTFAEEHHLSPPLQ